MHQRPCHSGLAAIAVLLALAPAAAQSRGSSTRWLKGNLHTHSLWSDGNDFPEMIADWYRRHGYRFLVLSDHNVLSQGERWIKNSEIVRRGGAAALARYRRRFGRDHVETRGNDKELAVRLKGLAEIRPLLEVKDRFLMIQGEEISDSFDALPIHVNATNIERLIRPQHGGSVREVIQNNLLEVERQSKATGKPILGHLNHPNFFYAVTAEDLAHVLAERYFEVYNGHPAVHHLGDAQHPSVERIWDIANTLRIAKLHAPPLMGLAVDDSHNYHSEAGSTPGRGWVMVRCPDLEADAIIAAMQRGDFYASSGVSLRESRFSAEKGLLEVEVLPEKGESYTIEFVGTLEGYDDSFEQVVLKNREGKVLRATNRYSADVGRVLETVHGQKASYRLTGKEYYVRAVVRSDTRPVNPAYRGQVKQAWTQPVGWRKRIGSKQEPEDPPAAANPVHRQGR